MRAILPGQPNAELAAVTTGLWAGRQLIIYISGHALVVLNSPRHLLQTTYTEDGEGDLVAVVLDEPSGKIATASKRKIYIYKPHGLEIGLPKWTLQHTLALADADDEIRTLSWGTSEELLVGSSCLTLFSTHDGSHPERLFAAPLASPAAIARFSYDAIFIASTARYDRLVKIWHRLSFGSVEERFDVAYLLHPAAVTGLHWRRPRRSDQSIDNVLYTISADNHVRVWLGSEQRAPDIFQLYVNIDLVQCIKPHTLDSAARSARRYVFFVDGAEFAAATKRAGDDVDDKRHSSCRGDGDDHCGREEGSLALRHVVDVVAGHTFDVCVVLDDRGNMSAWDLGSVNSKVKPTSDAFNIAHADGLNLHFATDVLPSEDNVLFYSFFRDAPGSPLTLLMHHFDGRIEWMEGRIDQLFHPCLPTATRLERRTILTGHTAPIKKAVRTASGRALISRTDNNVGVVWRQETSKHSGPVLARHSSVQVGKHIHRTALLAEGDFIVFLHHETISLWDARSSRANEAACCKYEMQGKPLCLLIIPEVETDTGCVYLATISSEMKGIGWEVRLPPRRVCGSLRRHHRTPSINQEGSISIKEICRFDLGDGDGLAYVIPVDPAGTPPVISGFLDTFARDIAISYTTSGVVKSWTARVSGDRKRIEWLLTSTVDTGVSNPTLCSGTSIRKAALVNSDKTGLTIWSTRSAQLEHEERFEAHDMIQDIDWSSSPDNQSILAVGFPHRVVIYAQLRYNYLDHGPSWAAIREVRIRELTPHPIGDSVWLGSGNLVIGAGNQLFIQDEHVEVDEGALPDLRLAEHREAHRKKGVDLFTLVSRLNGPLPVYHPQLLAQCVLLGKLPLVQQILISLYKTLKFYTEGDDFDALLGLSPEDFLENRKATVNGAVRKGMQSSYADFTDEGDEPASVTEHVAASLNSLLQIKSVPQLSNREQFHLADIVECVGTVEKHRRSIDDNACRFLLFFRQHYIRDRDGQRNEEEKPHISWREIAWAFYSGSQDILLDLVSRHFQGRMLWKHAKEAGIFMWMTDINALRAQFEVIARNEYTKTDEKNPVDCSLYYLALRKKAILVGLWRMATWSREQPSTYRLLQHNFQDARWKTAALKNAYALMGKRRFEYAAAFFLLADQLQDAIAVISTQMKDMQLALAVARVYEGDDGPVLHRLLVEKVLPRAAMTGNRWMATWAFWMLGKRDMAVRALVTPLATLLSPPDSPSLQSRLFLTDDPALVALYRQLRDRSLQTLRGALAVQPRAEWEFVMHTARLYERMGCDVLALDLVCSWSFLAPRRLGGDGSGGGAMLQNRPTTPLGPAFDGLDPRKLLRRRSSLVVADLPTRRDALRSVLNGFVDGESVGGHGSSVQEAVEEDDADGLEDQEQKKKKKKPPPPPPTQFQEPDVHSLLDAFGL